MDDNNNKVNEALKDAVDTSDEEEEKQKNGEYLCSITPYGYKKHPTQKNKLIIDEQTRFKCNSYLFADSNRADELEKIFESGFDEPVAIKIWPKLKRIVCNGYGVYRLYTENCMRYTKGVNFNNSYLGDSTAIIGFALPNTNNSFVLNRNNSFIEFLPLDTKDNHTIAFDDVKKGQEYEVVITNNAGLYRVKTNIVVKIKNVYKDNIIINYSYYIPETYSFENEKMYETRVSQALILLINGSNIAIEDFAFEKYPQDIIEYLTESDENSDPHELNLQKGAWLNQIKILQKYNKFVNKQKSFPCIIFLSIVFLPFLVSNK